MLLVSQGLNGRNLPSESYFEILYAAFIAQDSQFLPRRSDWGSFRAWLGLCAHGALRPSSWKRPIALPPHRTRLLSASPSQQNLREVRDLRFLSHCSALGLALPGLRSTWCRPNTGRQARGAAHRDGPSEITTTLPVGLGTQRLGVCAGSCLRVLGGCHTVLRNVAGQKSEPLAGERAPQAARSSGLWLCHFPLVTGHTRVGQVPARAEEVQDLQRSPLAYKEPVI